MDDFDDLELRALSAISSHISYIHLLDGVLDQINELLNLYQPPKTGKIRVERWKRTKGDYSVRSPMAVKWIQHRTTRDWRGVVVSTFKVSRSGKSARAFHEHHDRVADYLGALQSVLKLRTEAFTRIETFRRGMLLAERANRPKVLAISAVLQADLDAVPPDLRALQRSANRSLENE
ncbi:hypothetical protein SNE35_18665 [Paucibacter sp. R3-3]|uniref:Uncharacterized protein n=1 Tax=Roseateles agri TaxID=3098619 RepID=A0ABU5DJS3_9BURK|nr:hypothetical protein [Paucibacter sp. R3-3]MDY0746543.1 hypothetical protein [Paucibacter sp. R3-3]